MKIRDATCSVDRDALTSWTAKKGAYRSRFLKLKRPHASRRFVNAAGAKANRADACRCASAVDLFAGYPMRISAIRSPMITVDAIVLPVDTRGIADASAMDSPSTPYTERLPSTTDISSRPILQVQLSWK